MADAVIKGLEGVMAASSALCDLDGENGRLAYRGYDIGDLVAGGATFEEVTYLLWQGELPTPHQLQAFKSELTGERNIRPEVVRAMRLYPNWAAPMAALRAAVAMQGLYDAEAEDDSLEANRRKAVRLTAKLPTMVATYHRIRSGQGELLPRADLDHGENFLHMLSGRIPDPAIARALDASLVLYAEHELNASTFTARCVASTRSDLYSAVTAALGALKGPLHGGAGEAVMRTLEEIGTLENVEPFVKKALAEKRRFMGFGHRVYRAGDPRAAILRAMAEDVCRRTGQGRWYEMSRRLHEVVNREKGLIPNVDFYSASLWLATGIPVDLFVPVIAIARVAGWTAHLLEQYADNRLIRPRAAYTGPARRRYVALDRR